MPQPIDPIARVAREAPARTQPSHYPEAFASRVQGRLKKPLGTLFGLTQFGVNLTRLAPQAVSALRHAHSRQDEVIYILEGSRRCCALASVRASGPARATPTA